MKTNDNIITIPRKITKGEEIIILTRQEYERRIRQAKGVAKALRIIAEGEKAYRTKRTVSASSLEEAIKIYEKRPD